MSDDEGGSLTGILVLIAGFLSVVAIGAGLYFLMVKPADDKLDKAISRAKNKAKDQKWQEDDLTAAEDEKDALVRDLGRLKQKLMRSAMSTKSVSETNASLRTLKKRLANGGDIPALRESLQSDADRAGIALKKVVPRAIDSEGAMTRSPLEITVSGRFPNLVDWLTRVAASESRLLVPTAVKIALRKPYESPFEREETPPGEPVGRRLQLTMTLTDYSLGKDTSGKVRKLKNPPIRNKRWKTVRGHFWGFGMAGLEGKRDPFQARMWAVDGAKTAPVKPTPEIVQPDAPPAPKPPGPLTSHPTGEYEVMSIFKKGEDFIAVVVPPGGKPATVQVDDKLGSKGGIVVEISASEVLVDEPEGDTVVLKNQE